MINGNNGLTIAYHLIIGLGRMTSEEASASFLIADEGSSDWLR